MVYGPFNASVLCLLFQAHGGIRDQANELKNNAFKHMHQKKECR